MMMSSLLDVEDVYIDGYKATGNILDNNLPNEGKLSLLLYTYPWAISTIQDLAPPELPLGGAPKILGPQVGLSRRGYHVLQWRGRHHAKHLPLNA